MLSFNWPSFISTSSTIDISYKSKVSTSLIQSSLYILISYSEFEKLFKINSCVILGSRIGSDNCILLLSSHDWLSSPLQVSSKTGTLIIAFFSRKDWIFDKSSFALIFFFWIVSSLLIKKNSSSHHAVLVSSPLYSSTTHYYSSRLPI